METGATKKYPHSGPLLINAVSNQQSAISSQQSAISSQQSKKNYSREFKT